MSMSPTDKPAHRNTEASTARGNELLADSHQDEQLALDLGRQIEALDKLREQAWDRSKRKRYQAAEVLMGPVGYRYS